MTADYLDPSLPTKQCSTCHIEKLLTDFATRSSGHDGRRQQCKLCFKAKRSKRDNSICLEILIGPLPEKICHTCSVSKPLLDFSPHKKGVFGRKSQCKACRNKRETDWYKKHPRPTKILKKPAGPRRLYFSIAASRICGKCHQEKSLIYYRFSRKTGPQGPYIQTRSICFACDSAAQRQRYADDPKKGKERQKQWRQNNPNLVRAHNKSRYAIKRGAAVSTLSAAQWQEIQAAFDHRCAYCGKRMKGKLTQDHIIPASKGGHDAFYNIVPACRSYNSKKSTGAPLVAVQPLLLTLARAKKISKRNFSP